MSQAIATLPFSLFASQDYLDRSGTPESPADLKNCRCLNASSEIRTTLWKLKRGKEVAEITTPVSVIVNDFLTLRNLAITGGGIALLPTYAVHAECASNLLTAVLPDWDASSATLSAIYPSRRGATVKQRAFIDHVRDVAENIVRTLPE